MGFVDTLAKAKAYDDAAKQAAMQNAEVANRAKQMYAKEQQAMMQAEDARRLGLAHQLGAREMANDLIASKIGTIPNPQDPRFATPVMRDAMASQGLAAQQYMNQYNGAR